MSFMSKAHQLFNEKIGGVQPTKMNDELVDLKRKTSIIDTMVDDVMTKTKEYLQPNPAQRAMAAASKFSKSKSQNTPVQPEGVLAETMLKHGNELGNDLVLGKALVKIGESIRVLAEEKNALDVSVKQEFLDPFTKFQSTELKDVNHFRKKLHDVRVDYDYKKRKFDKAGNYTNREELKYAEQKLEEFVNLTHMRMHNLVQNEVEPVTQLSTFVKQLYDYHHHCTEILEHLLSEMEELKYEAAEKPKVPFETYYLEDMGITRLGDFSERYTSTSSTSSSSSANRPTDTKLSKPLPPPPVSPRATGEKRCRALYDFEAENDGELSFREGEEIIIIKRIDDNWYEGKLNGRTGFFPSNHVQAL